MWRIEGSTDISNWYAQEFWGQYVYDLLTFLYNKKSLDFDHKFFVFLLCSVNKMILIYLIFCNLRKNRKFVTVIH